MRIALLGATGTIGRATAQALLSHGHEVVCPVRNRAGFRGDLSVEKIHQWLPGAELRFGDLSSFFGKQSDLLQQEHVDAIVSCLASRTGRPDDAWEVDYRLHAEILKAAKSAGVKHFVLLSAMCVQKPLLGFQQAKLAFEKELANSGLRYSIVRPTAFFKSLSGQVQRLQQGKPYLVFGDGRLTSCKPISDQDLAQFMVNCLVDTDKHNCILPIGGPGAAITPIEQGEYLFKRLGKMPRFRRIPIEVIDAVIYALRAGGRVLPALGNKAELAKIGRYYATESMLVWNAERMKYDADATPSFGTHTLFEHYDRLIAGDERVELGDHAVF
jgi:divinyl chlorophyllide a 8-vinyl-reductase